MDRAGYETLLTLLTLIVGSLASHRPTISTKKNVELSVQTTPSGSFFQSQISI